MLVSGPVTFANVRRIVDEGTRHVREGVRTVDLAELGDIDSSMLAAMLAWIREGRDQKAEVSFENLPEGLVTLARVYGVEPFLSRTVPVV
jgi:phospholipid transport system transporter-binding protein